MISKSQVEKEIEGNSWFEETADEMQSKKTLSTVDIKIIIAEAITEYLTTAISFNMFIEIMDKVGERKEIGTSSDLTTITTKLLSLSKYGPDPIAHKMSIIEVINDVVNELEKNRK
jgi:hypothetical protein